MPARPNRKLHSKKTQRSTRNRTAKTRVDNSRTTKIKPAKKTSKKVHTNSFEITSGALCFGEAHNVRHGASQAIKSPSVAHPECRGTVFVQPIEYNYAAVNGTWTSYPLYDKYGAIGSLFCCHSSIDKPLEEIKRILRIAGSPYDHDSARFSDGDTFENRVLLINRYDWGYYDNRGNPVEEEATEDGSPWSMLVDYSAASSIAEYGLKSKNEIYPLWGTVENSEEEKSVGVRLMLRNHEYQFGRFGLNEDRSAVASFLFFSSDTQFSSITFEGQSVKDTIVESVE